MRLALTITELYPGGAERCFVQLARFLHGQGHEVAVWQLWPTPPEEKQSLITELNADGIPCHSTNTVRAIDLPRSISQLRRELSDFAPDLVQSFLFHANFATALAMRTKTPPLSSTPLIGGVRVSQPQRLRCWLERAAFHRMRHAVCVSQSVADHCVRRVGVQPEKLTVIPNGFDFTAFEANHRRAAANRIWSQLGTVDDARVLLFVGRLHPQKGIVEFMQLADGLLSKLPEHQLVLIGDGPERARLERLRQTSDFADRIHLCGFQAHAIDWIAKAEVFLLPAKYEGMPNVILEAMATGTPCVSFDVDGVGELLGSSEVGQLQRIRKFDLDAFQQRIIQLASSEPLRDRCSLENQSRAKSEFDLRKQLLRYQELYANIVNSDQNQNGV